MEKDNSKPFRETTWEDYGLDCFRRRELQYFCLQYPERVRSPSVGARLDCLLIEQAAREAATAAGYDDLFPAIIRNVTQREGYGKLGVPFGPADFYGMVRNFYHRLDALQEAAKAAVGVGDVAGTNGGARWPCEEDPWKRAQEGGQASWLPQELGIPEGVLTVERWD